MKIANRETYGLLADVLLLLIRQYPVAVSYPKLRVTKKASATTISAISSVAVFVL